MSEYPAECILNATVQSLDELGRRTERNKKLLETVRELLIDYCYSVSSPIKDSATEYPQEIKTALDILTVVKNNADTAGSVIADSKKELKLIY